ncbi:MAG TPA: hypothetical protein VF652_00405, partial [Allosphingosinicella sp.]
MLAAGIDSPLAFDPEAVPVHAHRVQGLPNRLGAALRQDLVGVVAAYQIGMAVDPDRNVGIGAEIGSERTKPLERRRAEAGASGLEKDVLEVERRPVAGLPHLVAAHPAAVPVAAPGGRTGGAAALPVEAVAAGAGDEEEGPVGV